MDTFNKTENLGTTTIPDAALWIIAVWYDNSGKGVVTEWTDDFFFG